MSLLSMTGYGKSESNFQDTTCSVEIRSVNNRFLDITCKLPKELSYLESELKNIVKSKISRGSLNLFVTLGSGNSSSIPRSYNKELVEAYLQIAKEIQAKHGISGEVHLEHILSQPDLFTYKNDSTKEKALCEHLIQEVDKAVDALIQMRIIEGKNLEKDLLNRLEILNKTLDKIEILDPERIVSWKEKFQDRLKVLMADTEIDPSRILLEASITADKLDINEEITRFRSHNNLFAKAIQEQGPKGKKLNFILQEMGREANTLGTKCQDAEIQSLAILLKDEIESMREQVMNIE